MDIKDMLEGYPSYLKGIRDVEDSTVKAYLHDINQYIKYFKEKVDPSLEAFCIDEYHLCEFSMYLQAAGNNGATRERRLNGVEAFWNYLHRRYGYPAPIPIKTCGIRIKNDRNRTPSLNKKDYLSIVRLIYDELSRIT